MSVQTTDQGSSFSLFASASFGAKRDVDASEVLQEGCVVDEETDPLAKAPPSDSAGDLELDIVLGSKPNALALEFDPAMNQYASLGLTADGHASGAIRFRAHGDVVPAFEAEIPALAPVKVVAPAAGAAIGARDLPVSWSFDGDELPAIVYVSSLNKHVRCYAGKKRELVVPASLVTVLLATQGDLRIFVLTARTAYVDAGDYRVSVSHNTSTHVELTRE